MTKPSYVIDVTPDAMSALEAHAVLAGVPESLCFHHRQNLRLPIGIYNISLTRISDKVQRLSSRLEEYFRAYSSLAELQNSGREATQDVIDYLELTLYAAAEHVDDIKSIAKGFFKTPALAVKSKIYQNLLEDLKPLTRHILLATNSIKHAQARIRIFTLDYSNGRDSGCLHGYIVEGVKDGEVGPSHELHERQIVFSITSVIWEVLTMLLNTSRRLVRFVETMVGPELTPRPHDFAAFKQAVISACRLPLYTFGERNPIEHTEVTLTFSEDSGHSLLDSGLCGSALRGWHEPSRVTYHQCGASYEGDGTTVKFKLFEPDYASIGLHAWEPKTNIAP